MKLITAGQSGMATITAFSGGASTNIQINVGSAAVDHVLLTASPQTLGPSGGTSTVNARVENVSGAGVPGVAVTFTTDAGSLSPTTATTNSDGVGDDHADHVATRDGHGQRRGQDRHRRRRSQSAHRRHARSADNACRGGRASVVHCGRVGHGEHPQRHPGLRRRLVSSRSARSADRQRCSTPTHVGHVHREGHRARTRAASPNRWPRR